MGGGLENCFACTIFFLYSTLSGLQEFFESSFSYRFGIYTMQEDS